MSTAKSILPHPPAPATPALSSRFLERTAKVWCVDTSRGDLYVVHFPEKDQLVSLIGGIANDTRRMMNVEMNVLVDSRGDVVKLPHQSLGIWMDCHRLTP